MPSFTAQEWNVGIDRQIEIIRRLWPDLVTDTISEYAASYRMMPNDSPRPGPWSNAWTPYLVEIMDDMSPRSPIQQSITMKSRKLGITAASENVVGFFMKACPTPIMYATATDDLCADWMRRLEHLIDSFGLRDIFGSQNLRVRGGHGDKGFEKDFPGGRLKAISWRSMAAKRGGDYRLLIVDEVDGGPPILAGSEEGRWFDILKAHTMSWGARKKIMAFSSPTTEDFSEIYRQCLLGDFRKFIVPCPYCEREQELVHLADDAQYGIKGITNVDGFQRAVYICQYCFAEIENHHKVDILARGHWEPTKKSSDPTIRSRQISALYSPLGMLSWDDYYREYLKSRDDPEAEKTFCQIYRGMPYHESGARPDLEIVMDHKGRYREGELQPGVVWLSGGMDVQRGKNKPDNPDEGPRLELEILGNGEDYRTWSLLYKKFYGPIDDPFAGAWEAFWEWCTTPDPIIHKLGKLAFQRSDGMIIPVSAMFIDSGDGSNTDIVYRFCSRTHGFIPSKGTGWVTEAKLKERGDVAGPGNVRHYRWFRIGTGELEGCEISTNYYKEAFFSRMKTPHRNVDPQLPGYCDFPAERNDYREYFEQLRAEERRSDGSYHKVRIRNEALDCRVYAMAAAEAYVMGQLKLRKEWAIKNGATQAQADAYTAKEMIRQWTQALAWKKPA
jgi:phage terminase large subunit GpA-like protein